MITVPTTWQLLEHVRDAIKLVQASRGFLTDIGLAPVALEGDQLPEDDAPYTLVLATDIDTNEEASTRSTLSSEMDIVIECAVPFAVASDSQLQAHRARFDVLRALIPLRKDIKARPRFVNNFSITGSRIGQPEGGAAVVIVQVTARAVLTETISPANP